MQDNETYQVLIIEDRSIRKSSVMRSAVERLSHELAARNIHAENVFSYSEAYPLLENNMDFDCILLATDMELDPGEENRAEELLSLIGDRQHAVPLFLLADHESTSGAMSVKLLSAGSEFVWIFEDSPVFIAGRIEGAIMRYRENLLPPLMKAIVDYNSQNHEYSWAAPGHQGGIGFTKTPSGKKFYDFYGENLFRTDTGIERVSIGSLLDHTGAFGESEKLAAKVFGADASYSVVVGTSGSNRTIMQACVSDGDVVICDRNCHKSIEQGLILTGAVPIYLKPVRNVYGIIGPIPLAEMSTASIQNKLKASTHAPLDGRCRYSVVTNCTYDGICYNAKTVESELEKAADAIHFDEAWYGYARFNPIYADHYAMRGNPKNHRGATVFATHSTHKLLNALSQASYIHVREGRLPVDFDRFNQAYMMHATTSPLYAICASNDVAVSMMKESGRSLTSEVLSEAIDFRQNLARITRDFEARGSWFFRVWNAEHVTDPATGKVYEFADAPKQLLMKEQRCWKLRAKDSWHGFSDLTDNYAMLDPIKVSILAPGMHPDGTYATFGVPAALVSSYIYRAGIVPTRTTDFQLMFLFSMGITKGKWGTLLNALLRFKELYDANAMLCDVLPELVNSCPACYEKLGLHDLGEKMFEFLKSHEPGKRLNQAFETLPEVAMTPREAYRNIVKNNVELVPAEELPHRITANSVIPYPPGIPMLMSGERFGGEDSPQIAYLKALHEWDKAFPGFEHETEGSRIIRGIYHVLCVKE